LVSATEVVMAKKKAKLLPKKIAGVKIPKTVRRGEFGKFLASPDGQKMVAQALVVAAGAVMGHEAGQGDKAKGGGAGLKGVASGAGAAIAQGRLPHAFAAAIDAFKAALEPPAYAEYAAAEVAPEPPPAADAKKKRSAASSTERPVTH
jgi:hypothetical protein